MRGLTTVLVVAFLGTAALGQDFDSRYDVTGSYAAIIDGTARTFYTTFDKEKSRASISRLSVLGKTIVNVSSASDTGQGKPTSPRLEVQLGPAADLPQNIASITLTDGGIFMADETNGRMAISQVTYGTDGSLSFDVTAELVEMAVTNGELAVVAGGGTRNLTGSFAGVLPAP